MVGRSPESENESENSLDHHHHMAYFDHQLPMIACSGFLN